MKQQESQEDQTVSIHINTKILGKNCVKPIQIMKKFKKCKKVGIEKKVKKQDGMSTIIVNYSDKIIRR